MTRWQVGASLLRKRRTQQQGVVSSSLRPCWPSTPPTHPCCLAGPRGRRGDQVGGFTLMNVADLRRVAPLWLKYTEDVRFDPDVSCMAQGGCWPGRW